MKKQTKSKKKVRKKISTDSSISNVKKRKRRTKKELLEESKIAPVPGSSIYWNQNTELAIIEYNKCTSQEEKNLIYNTRLHYPLNKMIENVINRFKFPYIKESHSDLKNIVLYHLICNLDKFTEEKGRAFSYFSVIAKNYLIYHNNGEYKEEKISISLNHEMANSGESESVDNNEILQLEIDNGEEQEDAKEFVSLMITYWDNNVHRYFKKKKDRDVVYAILELFKRSQNIENFNKKSLYLLIREQTNAETNHITRVLSKMKIIVQDQMKEYYNFGTVGAEEDRYFKY